MDLKAYLIDLANRLDEEGDLESADAVDHLAQTNSLQKVAQYVGAIGYVLKQNRAMANCIRKKRVANSGPMQEVVMDCLKEYQDGQDYNNTSWTSKYAQVVQNRPEMFDLAHIHLISEIGQSNDMETHIGNVNKAHEALMKVNKRDPVIAETVDHLDTFGDLLREEVGLYSPLPFKVAAPASSRSWWSQLFNPTEAKWWNPRSWSNKSRSRGEIMDAKQEMDQILQHLMQVTSLVQSFKLNISRVKSMISYQDMNEYTPEVQEQINRWLGEMDPNDWESTRIAVNQLLSIMQESPASGSNNLITNSGLQYIPNTVNNIYEHLSQIQQLMMNLRQREPIIGYDQGPSGMVSPSHEYEALNGVLDKLYTNPLNEEYLYYARRMHARLDDRLRGIKTDDEDMLDWYLNLRQRNIPHDQIVNELSRRIGWSPERVDSFIRSQTGAGPEGTTSEPDSVEPTPTEPSPTEPEMVSNETPAPETGVTDPKHIRDFIDSMMNYLPGDDHREKAEQLSNILSYVFNTGGLSSEEDRTTWEAIKDQLARIQESTENPSNMSESNVEKTLNEIDNSTLPEKPEDPKHETNRSERTVGQSLKDAGYDVFEDEGYVRFGPTTEFSEGGHIDSSEGVINILDPDTGEVIATADLYTLTDNPYSVIGKPREKTETPDDQRLQGANKRKYTDWEKQIGASRQGALNGLVKLADEMDKIGPNLADIIDEFIRDHGEEESLLDFPSFSSLIREK